MSIVFFTGSIGDTDLAKETINKLIEEKSINSIFLIPLTTVAEKRTEDFINHDLVSRITLEEITEQKVISSEEQISGDALEKIMNFLDENDIRRAYIGVPSTNNEIPFQIAAQLKIPFTIAYEYMFKPEKHSFWSYVNKFSSQENHDFAIPLNSAKNDILALNPDAKTHVIGHISLDRTQTGATTTATPPSIRESLSVNNNNTLAFISGTTQPTEIDAQFIDALLRELSTGRYPNLQLRMGIHPGIKDPDAYLQALLQICEQHQQIKDQFKIILTSPLEKRLQHPLSSEAFIIRCEISGPDAAQAADAVAQAVPGAILNEAAFKGKPSYFHEKSTIPYLPENWFSKTIPQLFTAKSQASHSPEELGLDDTAANNMAKLMKR